MGDVGLSSVSTAHTPDVFSADDLEPEATLEEASKAQSRSRRCALSRTVEPVDQLVRFVLDPDAEVVPDLAEKLPGRGMWLRADRSTVNDALKRRTFARSFRCHVHAAADLADMVEAGLARRVLDGIGLAQRAGLLVQGFDNVANRLRGKPRDIDGALLITAKDASLHGDASKLRAKCAGAVRAVAFSKDEIGRALGRAPAAHVFVERGRLASRIFRDLGRLSGFRDIDIAVPESADNELIPEVASAL